MNRFRNAFTILEVMVALTLTLLMMLALARAFQMIGNRITQSQAELELSTTLREVGGRLRGELDTFASKTGGPITAGSSAFDRGYLTYYEGPMTNTTTSQVAIATTATQAFKHVKGDDGDFVQSSRYGDIDDVIAFTIDNTPAPGNPPKTKPFVGFIPYGVLAAQEFKIRRDANATATVPNYDEARARQLVPFYSLAAEIVYWVSPEWDYNAIGNNNGLDGTLRYDPTTGYPLFKDRNQDLLPDRMNLHRRVLLIRPDLNITYDEMVTANTGAAGTGTSPQNQAFLPYLDADAGGGNQRIVPLSSVSLGTSSHVDFFQPDGTGSNLGLPGGWNGGLTTFTPNWLTGMANLQQFMDLSVSRATDDWSTPNLWQESQQPIPPNAGYPTATPSRGEMTDDTSTFGLPTPFVRANTMINLNRPENRFAVVRMPESYLSSNTAPYGIGSTYPLLALCPPHPFMVNSEQILDTPGDFLDRTGAPYAFDETLTPPVLSRDLPAQGDPDGYSGAAAIGTETDRQLDLLKRYGRFTMTGFIRPEFNLQDRIIQYTNPAGTAFETASVNRSGSDIVARDILSFDIKVYDETAPSYIFRGAGGEEGNPGDDDGDGIASDIGANVFDPDELGFVGSDDELVTLNDLNIRRVLFQPGLFSQVGSGAFVDLNYAILPGHPIGSLRNATSTLVETLQLESPFSGIAADSTNFTANRIAFSPRMQQSGRFVIRQHNPANSPVNSFFQSTYDTWTATYRTGDRFDQEGMIFGHEVGAPPNSWRLFGTGDLLYSMKGDLGDGSGANNVINVPVSYRNWSNMEVPNQTGVLNSSTLAPSRHLTPSATYSLPARSRGVPPPVVPPLTTQPPTNRIDAAAPVGGELRGIQIQIRFYDEKASRIRQQTIIQDF